jgi:acetoin utilization deacetylase AcuC-like enzyme
MDDETFLGIFEPVIQSIFDNFHPTAAVVQSGADSISGDRLGCFNLSVKGCVFNY